MISDFLNDFLKTTIKSHLRNRENQLVDKISQERNQLIHSISHNGNVFICSANKHDGVKVFFSDLSEEHATEIQEFSDYVDLTYRELASAGSFVTRVVNRQANTFGDIRELLPSFLTGEVYRRFNVPDDLDYISDPENIAIFKKRNEPKMALLAELNLISTMVA